MCFSRQVRMSSGCGRPTFILWWSVGCSSSPTGVIEPVGPWEEVMVASVSQETMLLFDVVFYKMVSDMLGAPKVYPADHSKAYGILILRLL
jgi:hypothetical protein